MGIETLQAEMIEARDARDAANSEFVALMDDSNADPTELESARENAERANDALHTARNAISAHVKAGGAI